MKGIGLLLILSICFVSSSCNHGIDVDRQLTWTEFVLNDSLFISMPETYGKEPGIWTGRDTWGFYKSRKDMKVEFRFEVGPGTPYSPDTVTTVPDTHIVYPYGHKGPESHITKKYTNLIMLDIANQKHLAFFRTPSDDPRFKDGVDGVVLVESLRSIAFTEILFVSYDLNEEGEVLNILKTIRYK